jgi:hypothetical protein
VGPTGLLSPFPVGDGVDLVPQRAPAAVDHENWDYETRKRRTTIILIKHTEFWPNFNSFCFTIFSQPRYPLQQYLLTTMLPRNAIETERLRCHRSRTTTCTHFRECRNAVRARVSRPQHCFHLILGYSPPTRPLVSYKSEPPSLEPHTSQTPPSSISALHHGRSAHEPNQHVNQSRPYMQPTAISHLAPALSHLRQPTSTRLHARHGLPRHIRTRQPRARTGHVTYPQRRRRAEGEVSRGETKKKRSRRA